MPKFRNREHVIDKLVNSAAGNKQYEGWAWGRFLDALDAAGFAVVGKPELLDKPKPTPHA